MSEAMRRSQLLNIDTDNQKLYEFIWSGKAQAKAIADTTTNAILRPCIDDSKNYDTTNNVYIEGDNLEVLKLLRKDYTNKIKMIYIDPPYNTGKNFLYKDNFYMSKKDYIELTNQKNNVVETDGRKHINWLNMMYPRLKLARNLLRDDGVIFISIDDNEQANLKKLCDEIFGEDNFISCIVWRRSDNQANIGNIARVKEYILCFCKNKEYFNFNKIPLTEKAKKEYSYKDDNGSFRRAILLHKTRGRHLYGIKTKNGNLLNGPWMIKEHEFKELDENNKILWTSGGDEQPYGKIYLHESSGQIPNDFWDTSYGSNQEASINLEKLFNHRIFDFPKSTILLKTLLAVSGGVDSDIVLDFFAGSGTTAHAVMQLNAEDGGNRKYILVQLPEPTPIDSEAHKAGYSTITAIGKERIRRAGDKIITDNQASTTPKDLTNLDIGFKVFKLDTNTNY